MVGLNNKPRQINKYNIQSGTNTVRLGNTLNLRSGRTTTTSFSLRISSRKTHRMKPGCSKATTVTLQRTSGTSVFTSWKRRSTRVSFAGEHFFSGLNGLLEWRVAFNRAGRDEPDLREALYIQNQATGNYRLREQTQSGFRQWIEATDKIWEPGLDFVKFVTLGSVSGSIKAAAVTLPATAGLTPGASGSRTGRPGARSQSGSGSAVLA